MKKKYTIKKLLQSYCCFREPGIEATLNGDLRKVLEKSGESISLAKSYKSKFSKSI